jgi:hypothetical protein
MAEFPPPQAPRQAVPQAPGTQPEQSITPISDVMQQGVQDPVGDFITTFIKIMESKGIDLDEAMGNLSVGDQSDLLDEGADPLEFFSREELTILVEKYLAIPEPERSQIGQQLASQLPPQVGDRLASIVRMVSGRESQQEVAP